MGCCGFCVGFLDFNQLGFVISVGWLGLVLWASLCRCRVLGVMGASVQISGIIFLGWVFLLGFGLGVLGSVGLGWLLGVGFLVEGFRPRSIVFIRVSLPSTFTNSCQVLLLLGFWVFLAWLVIMGFGVFLLRGSFSK